MFFLFFIWLLIILISVAFRIAAGFLREVKGNADRHSDFHSAEEKVAPQTGFQEEFGPPVETYQDPVCGVFLPETAAVAKNIYGHTVYFCSEKCARAYLAEYSGIRPDVKPSTA